MMPTNTPTATEDGVAYQDLTGWPSEVLATMGGYHERGELVTYDRPDEHPDGTVTVRFGVRTRLALPGPGVPEAPAPTPTPLPPPARYRSPHWGARGTFPGVLLVGVLVTVLVVVSVNADAIVGVVAMILGAVATIAGIAFVVSLLSRGGGGGCPGLPAHCGGCPVK